MANPTPNFAVAENTSGLAAPPLELPWLFLFLTAAAGLRLFHLGEAPFHHDESIHAFTSYLLWEGHPYRFDPVYHGPFLYWTNALVYALFGASDTTARLLPAVFSIGMVLPLWALKDRLGSVGWKVSAGFLVFSPTMTYYGRFLAHDDYCVLFTLLLVYLALRYRARPTSWTTAGLGLVTGAFLATKAVAYIHLGLFAGFAVLVIALNTFAPRWPRPWILLQGRTLLWRGRYHLLAGIGALLAVYITLYSSFFTNWKGVWDGVFATLSYWGGQQTAPRIPGPFYYYLPRLMLHEPVFWLALPAMIWAGSQRLRPFDLFLGFWALAALAVYGYAQEKVPWLLTHMLTPMFLLAGRWIDHLWRRRGRPDPRLSIMLALLLAWSLRDALWLSFSMPPATPHLLTYMASAEDLKQTAEEIRGTDPASGQIFVTGAPLWPLAWYLRDRDATYELLEGWNQTAVLVVTGGDDREAVEKAGFRAEDHLLQTWWYPDLMRLFGTGLFAYLLKHEAGESYGEYHYRVFRRPARDRHEGPGNG